MLNEFAWLLATCAHAKHRDGKRAVELAERACSEMPLGTNAAYIDTLAAAHAESGDFKAAVARQREAIQALPAGVPNVVVEQYRARLALYATKPEQAVS